MQTIQGEFSSERVQPRFKFPWKKNTNNQNNKQKTVCMKIKDPSGPEELRGRSLDLESEREAGIHKTVNINQQNHSMFPGKQPPRIPIVDYFTKCFMALLYSSVNKSSACTSSNSLIPRTLHKVHLLGIGTVRAKSRANFSLFFSFSPLENVVWHWTGNPHDRLPVNRENDCLPNEGTKSRSRGLMSLSWPLKVNVEW